MRRFGLIGTCCLLLAALSVGGCEMSTPSQVETSRIQVEDYMKTVLLPAHDVDMTRVDIAAGDYQRNSKSAPALVVPYLKSRKGGLQEAMRVGRAYRDAFAGFGVTGLRIDYAMTADDEGARNAILAYTATMAHPPKGCKRMPGARGADTRDTTLAYTMGCENDMYLAKMISRPADLIGVAGAPDSPSRREGPMMEGYMSGRTNPALTGLRPDGGVLSGGNVTAGQPTLQ